MYNHTIIESIQSQYFKCKEKDDISKTNLLCNLLDDNLKILIKIDSSTKNEICFQSNNMFNPCYRVTTV